MWFNANCYLVSDFLEFEMKAKFEIGYRKVVSKKFDQKYNSPKRHDLIINKNKKDIPIAK